MPVESPVRQWTASKWQRPFLKNIESLYKILGESIHLSSFMLEYKLQICPDASESAEKGYEQEYYQGFTGSTAAL